MKAHTFEVTPTMAGGQVVGWELCYTLPTQPVCGDGSSSRPYPNVVLQKNQADEKFLFTIMNTNDIKFAPLGPLGVHEKGQPGSSVNQIKGVGLNNNGPNEDQVLNFTDKNDRPSPLQPTPNPYVMKYQLNFVDAQGKAVKSIDPDVTNGGKTLSGLSSVVELVVLAVVAVALLAVWWKGSRLSRPTKVETNAGAGADHSG